MFSRKNISLLKVAMFLRQGSSAFNKIVACSRGSEIVGPAELRKREDESKTGGNWGAFRVFPTIWEPGTG